MSAYDVIVVGGGINGTGVARDCALRGLKVALFEKNDLGFGASGNNSGMIHGGPRYLTSEPEVTRTSCLDSGAIQRLAPHLVFRIPFLVPIEANGWGARLKFLAYDAFFACYDRYQKLKGGKSHTVLTPTELRGIEPGLQGNFVGAITFDEWGIDGARVCALNAVDAHRHGAQMFVHWEVDELRTSHENSPRRVTGIRARDTLSGQIVEASASVVVFATGAWSNLTGKLAGMTKPLVRPGKGIHVLYDRRLSNYGIVTHAIDGRQIFYMPWYDISWIATTDDDYYGDLDHMSATADEVHYLIEGVQHIFPAIKEITPFSTTAAARPTVYAYGVAEDALSRDHQIVDHKKHDQISGLYSMIGGKLASFRLFAEEMTDVIANDLGQNTPCQTAVLPLPGGEEITSVEALAANYETDPLVMQRLVQRQGAIATEILEQGTKTPKGLEVVCGCEGVMACEITHVCQHEWARTLDDVTRRTRLGRGPCGAAGCAARAAEIVAEVHQYSQEEARTMGEALLAECERKRPPIFSKSGM